MDSKLSELKQRNPKESVTNLNQNNKRFGTTLLCQAFRMSFEEKQQAGRLPTSKARDSADKSMVAEPPEGPKVTERIPSQGSRFPYNHMTLGHGDATSPGKLFCLQWVFSNGLDEKSQEAMIPIIHADYEGSTIVLRSKSTYILRCMITGNHYYINSL